MMWTKAVTIPSLNTEEIRHLRLARGADIRRAEEAIMIRPLKAHGVMAKTVTEPRANIN